MFLPGPEGGVAGGGQGPPLARRGGARRGARQRVDDAVQGGRRLLLVPGRPGEGPADRSGGRAGVPLPRARVHSGPAIPPPGFFLFLLLLLLLLLLSIILLVVCFLLSSLLVPVIIKASGADGYDSLITGHDSKHWLAVTSPESRLCAVDGKESSYIIVCYVTLLVCVCIQCV